LANILIAEIQVNLDNRTSRQNNENEAMAVVSQIWGKLGKLLGGLFLASGGSVSIGLLLGILLGQPAGVWLTILVTLLVVLGVAPAALGGFLLYTSFVADSHTIRDRFFRLLYLNQGKLSVLGFASATRLEPAIARRHLDTWAKEFHANFEVTDDGEIFYVFPMAALPSASEQPFEVIGRVLRNTLRSL
jgi:hypothetical protein